MMKRLGTFLAIALLATAQACSSGGDDSPIGPAPSATCDPTTQTTPNPAGAEAHCVALTSAVCDRGFSDCVYELGLTPYFASAAECRAALGAGCASDDYTNQWYDPGCGGACVGYVRTAPCAIFLGSEPQSCAMATGSLPVACTATIGPGTLTGSITSADPIFDGGYSRTYCISFTQGQSVVIQTSTPTTGYPVMYDTVLHLINPSGVQIAENDDYGSFYSRISLVIPTTGMYRITVRGFDLYETGYYNLTVTAY